MQTNERVKKLVKAILQSPHQLKWSAQGLGMMRTYFGEETRLHIWDSSLATPGVSPLHNHPWHLDSYVVAGVYKQRRYRKLIGTLSPEFNPGYTPWLGTEIKCGKDACIMSPPAPVYLMAMGEEKLFEGSEYYQGKDEVHTSFPLDGTVTLVDRTFTPDRDHAWVFWKEGDFVSAEPRPATPEEVERVTKNALEKWFK